MEPTIEEEMEELEEGAQEIQEMEDALENEEPQEMDEMEVKDEPESPDESPLWYENLANSPLPDLSQEDIEMLLDLKTEPETEDYDAQENAAENARKEEPEIKKEPEF